MGLLMGEHLMEGSDNELEQSGSTIGSAFLVARCFLFLELHPSGLNL